MFKKYLFLLAIIALPQFMSAQLGKVTGKIMDGEFNDILPYANVVIKGDANGATSDFDGVYSLDVEPGTYTLVFSFVGYETKEITGVVVEANKATEINVTLNPASAMLDEVVITTSVRKNTEASVLNIQKKSVTLMDGLSLEGIKKTGASSIASAIKTVPGVSVQGGKYVYVRGLGDRYTKSILNGMDIPGLDPDKNTVQMDIFPTSILENIIVTKSASADLPADFTGGVVNIITKDFPSQKHQSISMSLGYNPDMHLNSDYLSYDGGATDFLGFDDGTRDIPISLTPNTNLPRPTSYNNPQDVVILTRAFNSNLAAKKTTSLPNFGIGYSYGNQFNVGENKLGLIASIDYKNKTTFYDNFENGIYLKWSESDLYDLRSDRLRTGASAQNTVLLSGLAGLSYKTEKSKYKFNVLHIQNGEDNAAVYTQTTNVSNRVDAIKNYLEYNQRSITNLLLSGKHVSEDTSFTTEWNISPTFTSVQDKDARQTTFIDNGDGTYQISSDAGYPARIWRDLTETDLIGKLDFTKSHTLFDRKSNLKFGGLYSYKKRDYLISTFYTNFTANFNTEIFNGNPDAILADENIWTPENQSGSYFRASYQDVNDFEANQNTAAAYISDEFSFSESLKAVIGLRAEYYTTFFTGTGTNDTYFNNEKVIDVLDLFPSANLIYSVNDKSNVRASYYRTTARPSFKEKSSVQIRDLLTGLMFLGNLDLDPSYMNNFDLRYEFFGNNAQMFAISGFYKDFKNPIEIVAYDQTVPDQITPRNSESASVVGIELEARKNLGFITKGLENLSLNVNVSVMDSKLKMADQEYSARTSFLKDGESVDRNRSLQGQSPYLINTGLNYNNSDLGLVTGVFYNVQGKTLEVVGSAGLIPDVYSVPFNSLNFNFSKTLDKEQKSKITLKIENILGDDRESEYESYRAENQNFSFRSPGTTFNLGYSLSF
ncbi:TonB-dependent receptor [Pustulibacterium marinum]|uniref:TonB-dependent receptor n=1 Tax=Pustulibacterium marinum TaxID=1224947 RepID=A0A1I7EXB6_9FLAO|nr:TonB-dependent receptor [Pustulibacterium marinum]SFU28519.1 TonB-dependent receptor [Pustulibacterium marinum]